MIVGLIKIHSRFTKDSFWLHLRAYKGHIQDSKGFILASFKASQKRTQKGHRRTHEGRITHTQRTQKGLTLKGHRRTHEGLTLKGQTHTGKE